MACRVLSPHAFKPARHCSCRRDQPLITGARSAHDAAASQERQRSSRR